MVVAAVGFGLRQSKKTSQPGSGKETFGGDGNWEKLQIPQRQAAFFNLEPVMASATAERQQWLTDRLDAKGLAYRHDEPFAWRALADALTEQDTRRGE